MNALAELGNAARGWRDLILARPDGAARFTATPAGLVNAIGFYIAMVLLAILVQSVVFGSAAPAQVFFGLAANLLPLASIALVVTGTRLARVTEAGLLALMVPATYALGLLLAIAVPVALIGGGFFSNALLGLLGWGYFRLARTIGKMNIGVAIAFAALSIVALVALPLGLYMLTVSAAPAA
ncbi:MAG TPA: hypothetical protein GYA10_03795 [Alphaproteobacteria bacterium]|nr:hypothetical protein [Alphaproteobacteria bacterium]